MVVQRPELKKKDSNIVFAVAGAIYILFNFIVTGFLVASDPGGSLNFGIAFVAEISAFIPVAVFMAVMKKLYNDHREFFTTLSFKSVVIHGMILILFMGIHSLWQSYGNAIFFQYDYTFWLWLRDLLGFMDLRAIIYVVVIGLMVAVAKIQERESSMLAQSELKLKLQKASFRELELKMNPEIIYPNLDFIKQNVHYRREQASDLVLNLSKQLRILIDNLQEERITVQQDLQFFEYYFQAVKLRLNRPIEIKTCVSQQFLNRKIPSLVLLVPFLEALLFGVYAGHTKSVNRVIYRSGDAGEEYIRLHIDLSPICNAGELSDKLETDKKLSDVDNLLDDYEKSSLTTCLKGKQLTITLSLHA